MPDYKALYRKWRPTTFDDVCGQNAITDILKYEVENNKLSHAYLFCGSRGTGKTTCAKILAKAVNCLAPSGGNPCNKCEACRNIDSGISTDFLELDAASNTGVDNVRNMKDEIAFTPSELKYRVYIIDEIHMMSTSAFNALLKTLEEPPSYVIFILATTEFNKLPTTVVSRCQRFDFKRIPSDVIVSRIKTIADSEGIDITDDAARVIARVSRGGMRDAISLLELCAGAHRRIDDKLVFETVGSGNRDNAYRLIDAIGKADLASAYSIIDDIVMSSGDLSIFWQEILDSYRDIMVLKSIKNSRAYLDLTDIEFSALSSISSNFSMAKLYYHVSLVSGAASEMQVSLNAKKSVAEITLAKMCDPELSSSNEALALRVQELEKKISMMSLGVVSANLKTGEGEDAITVLPPKKESKTEGSKPQDVASVNTANKLTKLPSWELVLQQIAELKAPLAAKFSSAKAFKCSDGSYVVRMNSVFVDSLLKNEQDLALLRGLVAKEEGVMRDNVRIAIEPLDSAGNDLINELEQAITGL